MSRNLYLKVNKVNLEFWCFSKRDDISFTKEAEGGFGGGWLKALEPDR